VLEKARTSSILTKRQLTFCYVISRLTGSSSSEGRLLSSLFGLRLFRVLE